MRLALIGLTLWTATAHADVVDMPPEDCPPGSMGQTGHSGTWCEATACDGDGACEEGTCREYGLCVVVEERECGGQQPDTAEPCTFTVHEALGPCDEPSDCDRGTCEVVDRCVRGGAFGAGGCGCAQVPSGRVAFGVGLVALAGAAWARRRGVRASTARVG
jgi:hypothetical protein